MCGIAGRAGPGASGSVGLVESMLTPIRHRGPDDQGLYSGAGVVLGHRRLSILDLSARGAQPMTRGHLTITYNGEIYNYIELRQELRRHGQRFVTDTDSEVLLAAYSQWGARCVERFDGMWAFALHDSREGTVFCSRDRFGEKPFLYRRIGNDLLFASEVRQFQEIGFGLDADLESVRDFLTVGAKVDTDATFNRGISSLTPATNLVVSCSTGEVTRHVYYSPGTDAIFEGLEDREIPRVLEQEFHRAVTARLRSDVGVGLLLSGGIDSSLIASVAGPAYLEATGRPLIALTAQSGDQNNDESRYAKAVAEAANLAWEPVPVPAKATRSSWLEATQVIEQPLASSSHVLQLHVMRRAKETGCTVLLDGQGADESWMGYSRYTIAASRAFPIGERLGFSWGSAHSTGMGVPKWLAYALYFQVPQVAHLRLSHRLRPLGLRVDRSWHSERFSRASGLDSRTMLELQRGELMGEQLGALLRYADRTSMAVSVEDRLPFLDYRLVELAMATPTRIKFKGNWTKWPLRQQLAKAVPPDVAWRRGKVGFEAANDAFRPSDPQVHRAIRESAVLQDLDIRTDQLDDLHKSILWKLYAIALWEEVCLDQGMGMSG